MDEAKSLVHMSLTALFAVLILAAVLALITVGQIVWRAFSNQNDANRSMREYSAYSAFDGTTVRGQDVIALLHDTQGDPFVLILSRNGAPIAAAYTSVTGNMPLSNFGGDGSVAADWLATASTFPNVSTLAGLNDSVEKYDYSSAATQPSYTAMQDYFLNRGAVLQGGTAGYLKYDSYLLYESSGSSTIAGIIVVEQGAEGSH